MCHSRFHLSLLRTAETKGWERGMNPPHLTIKKNSGRGLVFFFFFLLNPQVLTCVSLKKSVWKMFMQQV